MTTKLLSALARDGVGLVGAACVVHGVAMWSPPAAWIIAGALLLAVAVLTSRRARGQ